MSKLIKSTLAATAFVIINGVAIAQTDSSAATPPPTETPAVTPDAGAPPTDPNAVPSDASATPVTTDSTAAPASSEAPPAAASAGDKPATRYKLYSGRHRGNNIIYDPKKQ